MQTSYYVKPEKSAFTGNIIVSQSSRGFGFGRALTQHMVEVCNNIYKAEPYLSVFNHNTPALSMYQKLGFRPYAMEQRLNSDGDRVALLHMKYEQKT